MEAFRIRTRLDSDTLHISGLKDVAREFYK